MVVERYEPNVITVLIELNHSLNILSFLCYFIKKSYIDFVALNIISYSVCHEELFINLSHLVFKRTYFVTS